jgi:hypothetical protein
MSKRLTNDEFLARARGVTFGELYKNTIEREANIRAAGYNLVSIWENDWKQSKKVTK